MCVCAVCLVAISFGKKKVQFFILRIIYDSRSYIHGVKRTVYWICVSILEYGFINSRVYGFRVLLVSHTLSSHDVSSTLEKLPSLTEPAT